eukprot:CCRYP_021210-RA/>CCRYP_021210-RA protein AED:0.47 eAED:0.47 QI:50/1/1/1/0/0/2/32/53
MKLSTVLLLSPVLVSFDNFVASSLFSASGKGPSTAALLMHLCSFISLERPHFA